MGIRYKIRSSMLTLMVIGIVSCGGDNNTFDNVPTPPDPQPPIQPIVPDPIPNFDADGILDANIRWTNYGVPHITADNLEGLGYGVGYAFAKDNICVLADQIIRFNSERAKYLGPDLVAGSGDSAHLINDFGFLTLGIRQIAEDNFASLSANSRALVSGYTQGYNRYLVDTGSANIDGRCAGQPWVQPIDSVDMLTYSLGVALLPGAANFLSSMFIAAPPGENFLPRPVGQSDINFELNVQPTVELPQINPLEMGSNGWGLGSDKTENGQGMLLANPHFPHTGALRFWQLHTSIPGYLNVIGGSLMGLPGAVNIGFNQNMAWTHTFSSAEHFVVYQLALDTSDESQLTHSVDGSKRSIYRKELEIDVAVGAGQTIRLAKSSYSTNYGPMVVVPDTFEWGNGSAFAIKDANLPNFDVIDHWLAMNLANDMDEFKQSFEDYDGVIFNNTMAASSDGQVFYIDDSTVPRLTSTAIEQLTTNPLLVETRQLAGFTVLPGFSTAFDFDRPVPYEEAPQYTGNDYVQNSNDSFWLTNLGRPITGVSPLYGQVGNQQSLRSRMAHRLLSDETGSDNLFSPVEVEDALLGNRSYLGESVLSELLAFCQSRGTEAVEVGEQSVDISAGCDALALWDGRMNLTSVGAPLFREFAFQFRLAPQWNTPFDPSDPANTPRDLKLSEETLQQFATAILTMQAANVPLDATLGEVQFVERSTVSGLPSGIKLPWAGAHNVEGGFNVFDTPSNDPTLLPRHTYPSVNSDTRLSSEASGYHINSGSSWMFVMNFTENGPQGRGLLTYSQSSNRDSEHFLDQTELYSSQPQLRPMYFTEDDIEANKIMELNLSSQ